MRPNLRQRLREEEPLVAAFSIIPSQPIVELIALAGFDAVILDMEHGGYGIDSLAPLVLAAEARSIYPIVRVQRNEPWLIGAALDAGAAGLLVPQVTSPAEARAAVSATRFAPEGSRGAHPWVRAADYSGRSAWFREANEARAVIVMIEGREGVAAADEILETPSLDGVFFGPVDLSHALGVPGDIDHPSVIEKIDAIIGKARKIPLATSIFTPSPAGAQKWLKRGVKMVAVGVDTAHVLAGLHDVVAATRSRDAPTT
jgi:4-hydroxy-2-oxoheptanedioate aldolase